MIAQRRGDYQKGGPVDDKRQHQRLKDPTVVVKIATVDKFRSFYLSDLSAGGIFIRCERFLPLHSEIDVKLIAPGLEEPLLLHGEIVRIDNDEASKAAARVGMGIKFKDLAPASAERLAALIAEYSAPAAPAPAPEAPPTAKAEMSELILELKVARESQEELQRKLAEAQALLGEYGQECDQLKAEREVLKSQLDASSLAGRGARVQVEGEREVLQAELERQRAENAELKARNEELEGQLASARDEFQHAETDEAATRALAERLAREKGVAEKKRKEEVQALTAELAKAREELDKARAEARDENTQALELTREVEQLQRHSASLQEQFEREQAERVRLATQAVTAQEETARLSEELGRVQAGSKEQADLRLALATEKSRASSLERLLADSKTQLERVRQKERELRRLVALVSSQDEDVIIVNDDEGEEPAEAEAAAPQAQAEVEAEVEAAVSQPPPAPADDAPAGDIASALAAEMAPAQPPPAPAPDDDLAEDIAAALEPMAEPTPPPPGTSLADDIAAALGGDEVAEAGATMPVELPAQPPPPPSLADDIAASLEMVTEVTADQVSAPPPAQESPAAAPPPPPPPDGDLEISIDDPLDLVEGPAAEAARIPTVEFGAALRAGRGLVNAPALDAYQPKSEAETQLVAWLRLAPNFPMLQSLARGTVSDETLVVLCCQFYEKGLIRLAPADAAGSA